MLNSSLMVAVATGAFLFAAPRSAANGTSPPDIATPADDIVEVAAAAGSFETLVSALQAAGLVETLKGDGPFTVFAPTDEAFALIPEKDLTALLADRKKLTDVLTYHVLPGRVTSDQVVKLGTATTANGQNVRIQVKDGKVMVDGATVVRTDIEAANGVIHVIDRVILPSS